MSVDIIYDFETLGTAYETLPIVSLATLEFNQERFLTVPYTFEDLVKSAECYKFDVKEQVEKYGRKIEKDCLAWWGTLPEHVRTSQLTPLKSDLSITELGNIMSELCGKKNTIWSRGSLDTSVTDIYLRLLGIDATYSWWNIRDTRSFIDGLSWGANMSNSFIPEGLADKFEAHNPSHDIAMDVMRMQYLVRVLHA
jgi:hypothetical protein